ncbi:hypothetical protein Tco_0146165 [Tanacetum coccineum]
MIIREVFVKLLLDSFGKLSIRRCSRVDGRSYLQSGAIDGSEANGIIRDPKLELESSHFTFDLVPLSYESVDVVVERIGSWRKRTKEDTRSRRSTKEDELRLCDIFVELQVRVGSNGNLLWEASVLLWWKKGGVRVAREDDRGVSEGREDARKVFQQRGSGAKRKLSRCGRNQMGNEPTLALPEGANDFVVYYKRAKQGIGSMLKQREEAIAYTSRQLKNLMKDCTINVLKSAWWFCPTMLEALSERDIKSDLYGS